jgi:lipopolysaccharide export system permease protein
MKVLTRYLLRAHLGPFLFAFGALTGVLVINTIARYLADLAGKGLPMDLLLRFFVLLLPASIALTLPMAVLIAVLYTFSQLTAENEIMALKASGIDLRRLVLPLLLVGVLLACGMLWFNNQVLAESNHRFTQLLIDVSRKSPVFTLREQTLNSIRTGDRNSHYYLRAAHINPATSHLRDVTIYDMSDPARGRTIYADSGTMAFDAARTDLLLTLYDGHLREIDFREPASFQRVAFERQLLQMPGVGNELERQSESGYRDERAMTIGMMHARIDTLRAQIATPRAPSSGAESADVLEQQIRQLQVEIQKKYSIAAAILIFVLIGAPLALRFPRGGIGMVIAVSMLIFALYWTGLYGGETLADRGYLSPVTAMWTMNIALGVLGIFGLWRTGRERNSPRG